MEAYKFVAPLFPTLLLLLALRLASSLLWMIWFRPASIKRALAKQGVTGPSPRLLTGTILEMSKIRQQQIMENTGVVTHNLVPQVFPEYIHWSKTYGKSFVYWMGVEAVLCIQEPEALKQLATLKHGAHRPSFIAKDKKPLLGNGLLLSSGEQWQHQRRVVGPAFSLEKIKGMARTMERCAKHTLMDTWERMIENANSATLEIEVNQHLTAVTADIISHTAFGSNYKEGIRVFDKLKEIQEILYKPHQLSKLGIPGVRYLPTSSNCLLWRLEKEVDGLVRQILLQRRELVRTGRSDTYGNDLLGLILSESEKDSVEQRTDHSTTDQQLIDQCKTFYFAGHETVAQGMTWTMFLLALNPDWQERARAEIHKCCNGAGELDADMLSGSKTIQMVLNESLRLYPPAAQTYRYVVSDVEVGHFIIPKGVTVLTPILALHHDRELWGEDVEEFKPERFAEGVSAACKKHPYSFLPFGLGVRICVGQSFAMLEMRLLLGMILSKFRFSLSPNYVHSPASFVTMRPKHGMQLVLEKVG